jgi:hypothetical protein
MIRFLLSAALLGGLLQHLFGEQPRRKGNGRRARLKAGKARPKKARVATASR